MKFQPAPTKARERLGRGEGNGHGKTCCRGHKGAGARAGYSLRAGFEGGQMPLFRKLPQRGFNRARFQTPCSVVNLSDLSKVEGEKIDLETLKLAGLIRPNTKSVKLLGTGEVTKAYSVDVTLASKSAKEKLRLQAGLSFRNKQGQFFSIMLSAFTNSLKIPELRQKIFFTLALLFIARVGANIPLPESTLRPSKITLNGKKPIGRILAEMIF